MTPPPPADAIGGGLDALLTNPAIATPSGFALAVLAFIAKQYFDSRRERRLDVSTDRESESGIVETTREALATARDQLQELREQGKLDRAYIRKLEANNRLNVAKFDQLARKYETSLQENEDLREILQDRIGLRVERDASQGGHGDESGRHRLGEPPAVGRGRSSPGSRVEPDTGPIWPGGDRGGSHPGAA